MSNQKKFVGLIVIIALVLFLVHYSQGKIIKYDTQEFKKLIQSLGIFGPVLVVFLVVITMVISPLASFPIWLACLAVYGLWLTLVTVLVANNLGSTVNFWIARKLGRPLIVKFVGQKGLQKIDHLAEDLGYQILILGRLFGGVSGDYLSYAAGLTSMGFKPFLLITILFTCPSICLSIYMANLALTISPTYLLWSTILGYTLAFLLPILIYRQKKASRLLKNR